MPPQAEPDAAVLAALLNTLTATGEAIAALAHTDDPEDQDAMLARASAVRVLYDAMIDLGADRDGPRTASIVADLLHLADDDGTQDPAEWTGSGVLEVARERYGADLTRWAEGRR